MRPSPADSAVAGPQNIYNLAVAAKKGLLDGIIEGTYVGSNPLLTIEDADRIAANEAENKRRVAELANEEAAKALGVTYQVPLPPNINVPQQNQQAQNIAANAINKIKEAEEDDHHSAGGD
jgi:allophanate hydrolase subunit 1